MLPLTACYYSLYLRSANLKARGDRLLRGAVGIQFAHVLYGLCREFGTWMHLAWHGGETVRNEQPKRYCVSYVTTSCRPLKVVREVIELVSILVVHYGAIRWRSAMERFTNEAMQEKRMLYAALVPKEHVQIATVACARGNDLTLVSSTFGRDPYDTELVVKSVQCWKAVEWRHSYHSESLLRKHKRVGA